MSSPQSPSASQPQTPGRMSVEITQCKTPTRETHLDEVKKHFDAVEYTQSVSHMASELSIVSGNLRKQPETIITGVVKAVLKELSPILEEIKEKCEARGKSGSKRSVKVKGDGLTEYNELITRPDEIHPPEPSSEDIQRQKTMAAFKSSTTLNSFVEHKHVSHHLNVGNQVFLVPHVKPNGSRVFKIKNNDSAGNKNNGEINYEEKFNQLWTIVKKRRGGSFFVDVELNGEKLSIRIDHITHFYM